MSKSKIDKKGRSKDYEGAFLMLRHDIIHSKAWYALKPAERAVLIQIWQRLSHNRENNGQIGIGQQQLANECNIKRDTVAKALSRLETIGFIECVTKGSFTFKKKHVSEYRLTFYKCFITGQLPTNEWAYRDV
jgi:hypothetical protein